VSEHNKTIARNFIEGAWNRRDMSVMNQFVAPNHVSHGPFTEQLPQGVKGTETFVTGFLTAFPDLKATIVKQESEGDEVKTSLRFTGTHTGPLMNIPATGKQATVPVVVTDRVVDGKIVETWSDWRPEGMFKQLGIKQPTN
jgi:steroid delta-isomerase-like uncharacterized protein